MGIYIIAFYLLCVLCALLFVYTYQKVETSNDPNFKRFQRIYILVYLFAMAGDWLQGPYVYALYEAYGMSKLQIELLFVVGFGSSMICGTFIGSFADFYGRRKNCILYGIIYGLSCITKHFNNFWILLIGRLFGGIATSILFSAFESWLICEHNKRGFPEELQATIFSHAMIGNSLIAIVSGVVAQYSADVVNFVAPFDVALIVLTLMCAFVIFTWSENYGGSGSAGENASTTLSRGFRTAFNTIVTDNKVFCLGVIQSLFEGSMYCFVLEWTPALTFASDPAVDAAGKAKLKEDGHRGVIPHGYIFASFMVAAMMGSSLFKLLNRYFVVESFLRPVFLVSALCFSMPFLFPERSYLLFAGFLVFEVCVGIFWPAIGTMRGKYVPEETRATIMNYFRVPLNLIVVLILSQNFAVTTVFRICTAFLVITAVFQHWLFKQTNNTKHPVGLDVKGSTSGSAASNDGSSDMLLDVTATSPNSSAKA